VPGAHATNGAPSRKFDTDQTRRQFLKEREDIATLQLPANNHLSASVNAVDLENRLGDV
jgi:hypothetical protein